MLYTLNLHVMCQIDFNLKKDWKPTAASLINSRKLDNEIPV